MAAAIGDDFSSVKPIRRLDVYLGTPISRTNARGTASIGRSHPIRSAYTCTRH